MHRILFPDSTRTTHLTADYSDGELAISYTPPWDHLYNETNVREYPITWRERSFICWLVCTQLPDESLDELTKSIKRTIDFYWERFEYRQRQRPKLPPRTVAVELSETTLRPPLYLPTDVD